MVESPPCATCDVYGCARTPCSFTCREAAHPGSNFAGVGDNRVIHCNAINVGGVSNMSAKAAGCSDADHISSSTITWAGCTGPHTTAAAVIGGPCGCYATWGEVIGSCGDAYSHHADAWANTRRDDGWICSAIGCRVSTSAARPYLAGPASGNNCGLTTTPDRAIGDRCSAHGSFSDVTKRLSSGTYRQQESSTASTSQQRRQEPSTASTSHSSPVHWEAPHEPSSLMGSAAGHHAGLGRHCHCHRRVHGH